MKTMQNWAPVQIALLALTAITTTKIHALSPTHSQNKTPMITRTVNVLWDIGGMDARQLTLEGNSCIEKKSMMWFKIVLEPPLDSIRKKTFGHCPVRHVLKVFIVYKEQCITALNLALAQHNQIVSSNVYAKMDMSLSY